MARQKKLSQNTVVAVYFCDLYSLCQRGSNESMNGLVRSTMPKDMGLSIYSQEQLDAIADEINNRARKGLGVRSPPWVLLINSLQHSAHTH